MKIMKKVRLNRLYWAIIACCVWGGCTEDEHPIPSYSDLNWYAIEEVENADNLDQLCYQLYQDAGVSFFYNDTLGSYVQMNPLTGESYVNYHKYLLGYNFVNAISTVHYALSLDRESLREYIEMYYNHVYQQLKGSVLNCVRFFVVDSLYQVSQGTKTFLDFYNDMANSVILLGLESAEGKYFGKMEDIERQHQMDTIFYKQVFDYYDRTVNVRNADGNEFKPFFALSEASVSEVPNGKSLYGSGFSYDDVLSNGEYFLTQETRPEEFGFLEWRSRSDYLVEFPMDKGGAYLNSDFDTYFKYIYLMTEEEFREKYKDWSIVLAKYDFLVTNLRNHGFDMFIGYGAGKYNGD